MISQNLGPIINQFVDDTIAEMIVEGVTLNISNNSHVTLPNGEKGTECNGYFTDTPTPLFAVGSGKSVSEWFPVYVHEYGHFTQWRDKSPEWNNLWIDGIYYDDFLDLLVSGEGKFTDDQINRFIDAAITIEADCERRVVELVRRYKLPIEIEHYCQTANSYVHFYNYIKQYHKWYIAGREPYRIKEVYSQFNKEIDDDFPLSWEYINLYEKYCF